MSSEPVRQGLAALRSTNRARVLHALRRTGEISRAELARVTGLSGTTISSLVSELAGDGVIAETSRDDRGTGRTGRPGRLLRLAPTNELVAAMDLGASTVRVAVADLSGRICGESSIAALRDGRETFERATESLYRLIEDCALDRKALRCLVVGLPGIVDTDDGLLSVSHRMAAWQGLNPAQWFTGRTGIPTEAENDANLAAWGEQALGAARGCQNVLFVNVSTGIGAGLIVDGRLYRGLHGAAGEIGHVQVREDGEVCRCGHRGCLETVASVPAALDVLQAIYPSVTTAADLADLVASGDRAAARVVTDAGLAVGRAVADLCNTVAPEAVVLGGAMMLSPELVLDAVQSSINRYTRPQIGSRIDVRAGTLGARAGVLGGIQIALTKVESEAGQQ